MNIKQILSTKIKSGEYAHKTQKRLLTLLKLDTNEKKNLQNALDSLLSSGEIVPDGHDGFVTPEQIGAFVGTVSANARGFAFIMPTDGGEDYFLPKRSAEGLYHGDKVVAVKVKGTKDEARVLRVISHSDKKIIGTLQINRNTAFVVADDPHYGDLFIPYNTIGEARSGDKVVCEIISFAKHKAPSARIVEILGENGDLFTEELSLIRSYDVREEFPDEVISEAKTVSQKAIDLKGRRDLRDKVLFTIDGEDTRDIDDAVSLEMDGENFVLGVHIADVAEYVGFKSKLDEEAYLRGTSIYFPDRVLPMLPKELSNGCCSLNENEDRFALSCVMTFDKNGKKIKSEIFESVIRSRRKTSYSEILALLEGDEKIAEKFTDIDRMCRNMQRLCLILEGIRRGRGSVNLDVKEAHIYLDKEGNIVIPDYSRNVAHRMIEQFMVAANESVAEFLSKENLPCLFRTHEKPSTEKAADFYGFIRDFGIRLNADLDNITPMDYQKVCDFAEGKPYSSIINKVMLRSMQKARYQEENIGHFGLASESYCHFTSPIRRYPDLFVHRVLKLALRNKKDEANRIYLPIAKKAGEDCSKKERIADDVERDVDSLYKLYYCNELIGEVFEATVSGVCDFGVFAELDNTIEGLTALENLPKDTYEFFDKKYLLRGRKYSFRLGDRIKVLIAGCDLGRRRVLFEILV